MRLYPSRPQRGPLLAIVIFLTAVLAFSAAFAKLRVYDRDSGQAVLKSAIDRAVVSCYAIEGRYPESLQYLIDNYGITVDTDKYYVTYSVFAANQRPEVRVLKKGQRNG